MLIGFDGFKWLDTDYILSRDERIDGENGWHENYESDTCIKSNKVLFLMDTDK